jgi:metallo-beta-lactamase family protein
MDRIHISFLGGVGTVTGSKYLVEAGGQRILVDCGLFQGLKQLRLRNWEPLPVDPKNIQAVVLTHAHIDHAGYLPILVRNGFKGRIFCTAATKDLCGILLPDAGYLAERDAEFANRHGFSKHHPALPLFTEVDARAALLQLTPLSWEHEHDLGNGLGFSFRYAGHILGAAMVALSYRGTKLLFTGDLGRSNDPIMRDPEPIGATDYLVVESTYGDRRRSPQDVEAELARIIIQTAGRGGSVLIPTFAVGRAQLLLYHLYRLRTAKRIPDIPIFLDSPMAINASQVFKSHRNEHRLGPDECRALREAIHFTPSPEESKAINRSRVPTVILSASGMATGGRVLHHLKVLAPDQRNTILFAGFQAAGTRGAAMVAGTNQIKIHGSYIPINADVINLDMLSAHADSHEIMNWLCSADVAPRLTFITHGEPIAADTLRHRIEEELRWDCRVPSYRDEVSLSKTSFTLI